MKDPVRFGARRPVTTPAGFVPVASSARPTRGLGPALQVTIGTAQRCPLCHAGLSDDEALVACAACLTVAHADCAEEARACPTLGCGRTAPTPAAERATAPVAAPERTRSWAPALVALALSPALVVAALLLRPMSKVEPIPAPQQPAVVFVNTPAPAPQPRVIYYDPVYTTAPIQAVPLLEVTTPQITTTGTVNVRGRIASCSGNAILEVTGPEGDLRLPATPGPFDLVITLPREGPHRVTVTLREPNGQATSVEREVTFAHPNDLDGRE